MKSIKLKIALGAVACLLGSVPVFAPICYNEGSIICGNQCAGNGQSCTCSGSCSKDEMEYVASAS